MTNKQKDYDKYFTTIHHGQRKRLKLSLLEYAVADTIYHLANNPKNQADGFCYMTKDSIAELLDVERSTIFRIIKTLIDKNLVVKDKKTKHLKTTHIWRDTNNNEIIDKKISSETIVEKNHASSSNLQFGNGQMLNGNSSKNPLYNNKDINNETNRYTHTEGADILSQWNTFAKENNLSSIIKLSVGREYGIRARMKEKEFNLELIFKEIKSSNFLLGSTGWKVSFDFVFSSPNNYLKIIEGKYRNGTIKKGRGDIFGQNQKQREDIVNRKTY